MESLERYDRVAAYIDLDAVVYNIEHMNRNIRKNTQILGVIKTDAYGHGATVDALPDIIHLLKDQGYSFRVVTTAIPPSW